MEPQGLFLCSQKLIISSKEPYQNVQINLFIFSEVNPEAEKARGPNL